MKRFKEYITESVYYFEVDNKWDAERNASSEESALKLLFPKAKTIEWIGSEDGASVYKVFDGKDHHEVKVSKK